jgi:DNA-binding response OmpR family regulator
MKDLNILILEDEFIICLDIKKTLKTFGFDNIFIAKNYTEALNIATECKIDLLFCDVNLGDNIDGIDTAKKIQTLYELATIFITAYNDDDTLKKASSANFIGYLLKPYRSDELKALIYLAIQKFDLLEKGQYKKYKNYLFDKHENKLYDKNKKEISLTKKEILLLSLLFNNQNSIITYNVIDSTVWKDNFVSDSTRRIFLHRFKNKFKDFNLNTEQNIGIKLV